MEGHITRVFPGNNSAEGFFSFYRSGLAAAERVYILKGGPGTGKSTLLRAIATALAERGYDVELWQCSSDNNSLDGVLIPRLGCAVVDGTAPHTVDPLYPGAVEEIVNLGDYWDSAKLREKATEIRALTDEIGGIFAEVYQKLGQAGARAREYDKRREAPDAARLAAAGKRLQSELFGSAPARTRHLFGGAITPEGVVDCRPELARGCKRRYYLCGNGAETLLREVIAAAEQRDLPIDIFHGALLPESIDMVLLPTLDCAVLAVEQAPAKTGGNDVLIELPAGSVPGGFELLGTRDELIAEAVTLLDRAHRAHDRLEVFYRRAMDFERSSALRDDLLRRILQQG